MITTRDEFLGGKIILAQPAKGYRAGIDPVLLAASIDASPGQSVLELGCGVGTALFCLAARVPGLILTGVELQPEYATLAAQNARDNAIAAQIITADLRALPQDLRQASFDHVMMNPPYFDRALGSASTDGGRDTALGGATALDDWIAIGAKRVRPKGSLTLIQRIERLPEILVALHTHAPHLGSISVLPIAGRADRAPGLFLLQARHGGRAPFHWSKVLVSHDVNAIDDKGVDYTAELREMLRNGASLRIRR